MIVMMVNIWEASQSKYNFGDIECTDPNKTDVITYMNNNNLNCPIVGINYLEFFFYSLKFTKKPKKRLEELHAQY